MRNWKNCLPGAMKLDPTANLHSKLLAYDILFTQLTPAWLCERFTVHLSLVYRVWMKRLLSGGWMRNPVSKKPVKVKGKSGTTPLVDTGQLYNDFDWEITGK